MTPIPQYSPRTQSRILRKFRTLAKNPKHLSHLIKVSAKSAAKRLFFGNGSEHIKKSYSQAGEDLIISYVFKAIGIEKPSYIDVGAHHPWYLSNTALLYNHGSRGINVEPDPKLFKAFTKDRPHDRNLNFGIADTKGELDFYLNIHPTLNSFSTSEVEKYKAMGYAITGIQKIRVETLNDVIKDHCDGKFPDLLTLDVEGLDLSIIKSIDFKKSSPTVICVETTTSQDHTYIKLNEIADFLKIQGYMIYADTFINTILLKADKWKNIY